MAISRREFLAAAIAAPALKLSSQRSYDLIIRGGTVFDGSGAAGRVADVAVRGAAIALVAAKIRETARDEIDAKGLAVAPGFIDIHSHGDGSLNTDPRAESVVRQGVTTIVVGQDGSSRIPNRNGETSFAEHFRRLEALPAAVNVASMVGLGTVRRMVVGEVDRPPTAQELAKMTAMVETALATGACGASTGLEYTPGGFAKLDELIALSRPLARRRLPYASHLRNEDDRGVEAVDEAIAIARGAGCPLQLSHLKTGGARNWPKIDTIFEHIDSARRGGLDVTFDRYPYIAWSTGLTNLLPIWALDGGADSLLKRLSDAATAERIREYAEAKVALIGGWNNVLLSDANFPADSAGAVGKRLDEWARMQGVSPYEATVGLLQRNRTGVSTVVFGMSEQNCERFLAHPRAMVCSDGGAFAVEGPARTGHPHPRGLGTFPRVLGHYVRERKLFSLATAIHKMSGMPAARLRLSDRGRIAVGAAADLVLLDPDTVIDKATFEDPFQYPLGIPTVVINGRIALRDGQRVGTGAGKGLRPRMST